YTSLYQIIVRRGRRSTDTNNIPVSGGAAKNSPGSLYIFCGAQRRCRLEKANNRKLPACRMFCCLYSVFQSRYSARRVCRKFIRPKNRYCTMTFSDSQNILTVTANTEIRKEAGF